MVRNSRGLGCPRLGELVNFFGIFSNDHEKRQALRALKEAAEETMKRLNLLVGGVGRVEWGWMILNAKLLRLLRGPKLFCRRVPDFLPPSPPTPLPQLLHPEFLSPALLVHTHLRL